MAHPSVISRREIGEGREICRHAEKLGDLKQKKRAEGFAASEDGW
jgi:hypothetical protein